MRFVHINFGLGGWYVARVGDQFVNRTVGQRHGLEQRLDSALNVRRNMLRSAVDQTQILVKAKSDL